MDKEKLVICDLDGTLFDTRRVNYHAYREALELAGLPVNFNYDFTSNAAGDRRTAAFCRSWAYLPSGLKKFTI